MTSVQEQTARAIRVAENEINLIFQMLLYLCRSDHKGSIKPTPHIFACPLTRFIARTMGTVSSTIDS
jgi:hypothetical protein